LLIQLLSLIYCLKESPKPNLILNTIFSLIADTHGTIHTNQEVTLFSNLLSSPQGMVEILAISNSLIVPLFFPLLNHIGMNWILQDLIPLVPSAIGSRKTLVSSLSVKQLQKT